MKLGKNEYVDQECFKELEAQNLSLKVLTVFLSVCVITLCIAYYSQYLRWTDSLANGYIRHGGTYLLVDWPLTHEGIAKASEVDAQLKKEIKGNE